MPNTGRNDDLTFTVEIDPDISKVEEATVKMKKDIDDVGKGTKEWEWPESHRKAAGLIQAAKGGLSGIGGAVGEMVGGPVGAEVGQMLGQAVSNLQNIVNPADLVNKAFGAIDHTLRALSGPLGAINLAFDAWQAPLQGFADWAQSIPIIGQEIGPAVQAAAAVPNIARSITEQLTRFAGLNSPATLQRFNDAVEDAQAVIGRAFTPVLELMTDAARMAADVLANLLPSAPEVRDALAEVREDLQMAFADIREALQDIGPAVRETFITTIRGVATVLQLASYAATTFARAISLIAQTLGWQRGEFRTSVGAAARPASIQGFEEYQRQLQISSYSQGTPGMSSIPGNVHRVVGILERIEQRIDAIPRAIGRFFSGRQDNDAQAHGADAAEMAARAFVLPPWMHMGGLRPPWFNLIPGW